MTEFTYIDKRIFKCSMGLNMCQCEHCQKKLYFDFKEVFLGLFDQFLCYRCKENEIWNFEIPKEWIN